jgi:hypothetical protein
MKGRDKRRRAVSRKGAKAAKGNTELLFGCRALKAMIDSVTCRAERRIQDCQKPNACSGCANKLHPCPLTKTDIHASVCEAGRDELTCAGCAYLTA